MCPLAKDSLYLLPLPQVLGLQLCTLTVRLWGDEHGTWGLGLRSALSTEPYPQHTLSR